MVIFGRRFILAHDGITKAEKNGDLISVSEMTMEWPSLHKPERNGHSTKELLSTEPGNVQQFQLPASTYTATSAMTVLAPRQ